MENPNNIIGICKECGDERRNNWQEENKGLKIDIGDFVKIPIKDDSIEHLWFQIIGFDDGDKLRYIGRCGNEPVLVKNIEFGDTWEFEFKDIEDYIKNDR